MSASHPPRLVLEGVPKIGYHKHLCPFPGALYACMEYLGDPCSYDDLMAITGGAFRRFWNRDDGGNIDLMYLAPEPDRRAFAALNYAYRVVPWDRAAMMAAIRESIARGRPVISFGIIGPPEAGIVAGYDRGGEVLYGYSYFQDGAIAGYYSSDDWFQTQGDGGAYALIVIGDKRAEPGPSPRELLVSTLRWAVDLARTRERPGVPDHVSGLAAYDAWADAMEVDADYPADDAQVMGIRVMVHGDQTTMLCDRASAAVYLRRAASIAPEAAAPLHAAADLYRAVSDVTGIWHWGGSMGPEVGQALADPALRRGIAVHIRAAGAKEARAVEQLEAALVAMA